MWHGEHELQLCSDPVVFLPYCTLRTGQRETRNAVIDSELVGLSHQCYVSNNLKLTNAVFDSFIFLHFHNSVLYFVHSTS